MSVGTGSVAVVTGAGRGIGAAIAATLRAAGWSVVGVDHDPEGAPVDVVGDVADPATHDAAVSAARDAGVLRGWVSNAAVVQLRPFGQLDEPHVDTMLDVDLRAYVLGAQAAVREFRRHGDGGAIVNVGSVHGRLGFAQHALYAACKAGVEGFTRSVVAELLGEPIRVNTVAPGAVMTEREVAARAVNPPLHEPIPLALFSSPAEIAAVVAFLLDPASAAINGATVAADRGLSSTFVGAPAG